MAILDSVQRADEHYTEKHASFLDIISIQKDFDLLLIGDSITRRWEDNPEIFNRFFSRYRTANFGIGGDCIENLRWRILNGELDGIRARLVILHIGTNNLPSNSPDEVFTGIMDIISIFRKKLPESKILLIGLLPRNKDKTGRDYMKMVKEVNSKLLSSVTEEIITFTDFGTNFMEKPDAVNPELLPDGLHPAEKGFILLGKLITPYIEKLLRN